MPLKRNKKQVGLLDTHRGFTLIELMVVLVILAILAATQYPSYLESVRKTRRAEGRAALMQVMQQQERYYTQNGSYIAFSSTMPNGYKWYSGNTPASSAYEITATACDNDTLQNCVLLTATPGTARVDSAYKDHACGTLSFASNGTKTAAQHGGQCW
jgi:type IV pilus assembly protein PilE